MANPKLPIMRNYIENAPLLKGERGGDGILGATPKPPPARPTWNVIELTLQNRAAYTGLGVSQEDGLLGPPPSLTSILGNSYEEQANMNMGGFVPGLGQDKDGSGKQPDGLLGQPPIQKEYFAPTVRGANQQSGLLGAPPTQQQQQQQQQEQANNWGGAPGTEAYQEETYGKGGLLGEAPQQQQAQYDGSSLLGEAPEYEGSYRTDNTYRNYNSARGSWSGMYTTENYAPGSDNQQGSSYQDPYGTGYEQGGQYEDYGEASQYGGRSQHGTGSQAQMGQGTTSTAMSGGGGGKGRGRGGGGGQYNNEAAAQGNAGANRGLMGPPPSMNTPLMSHSSSHYRLCSPQWENQTNSYGGGRGGYGGGGRQNQGNNEGGYSNNQRQGYGYGSGSSGNNDYSTGGYDYNSYGGNNGGNYNSYSNNSNRDYSTQ